MEMFRAGTQFCMSGANSSEQAFLPDNHAEIFKKIETFSLELKALMNTTHPLTNASSSLPNLAKNLYQSRRSVDDVFDFQGFSTSPAWDIMLDLFEAEMEGKQVSVSSACIGAACPASTALRWLKFLEDRDLVTRTDDPDDKRRALVHLTAQGRAKTSQAISVHIRADDKAK